jgi:hypothetical protein
MTIALEVRISLVACANCGEGMVFMSIFYTGTLDRRTDTTIWRRHRPMSRIREAFERGRLGRRTSGSAAEPVARRVASRAHWQTAAGRTTRCRSTPPFSRTRKQESAPSRWPTLDYAAFNLGLALLACVRDKNALNAYRRAAEQFPTQIQYLGMEDLEEALNKKNGSAKRGPGR